MVCAGLLAGVAGCAYGPASTSSAPAGTVGSDVPLVGPIRTIVLDAGHGGRDPGTSHYGLREKHLALDIAKRLRRSLEASGLSVVMTRETDTFIPLSGRPEIANRIGADLFVSVHINANNSRRVSGVEVYYPRTSVVSSSAQWPPSVLRHEIGIASLAVKQVLWDLVLGRMRSRSRQLAASVCHSMRKGLQASCRRVKPARFVVLRESRMPAVLVEVGYVSNQAEARRLGSAEYRERAARSIAQGIVSYIRGIGAQHI